MDTCTKVKHRTFVSARDEARRLDRLDREHGLDRPSRRPHAYRCGRCGFFHVGNTSYVGRGLAMLDTKDAGIVLDYRAVPLSLKVGAADDNSFTAYFATWDGPDRANDIIQRGAFSNLDDFRRDGFLLHDHKGPEVAYPTAVAQDEVGLRVSGRWHDTEAGRECRKVVTARLDAGLDAFGSIGYRTLASQPTYVNGKSCNLITKLAVFECSFVSLPCNPAARVVSAKGLKMNIDELALACKRFHSQVKEGRTISAATGSNLKELHRQARKIAAGVASLGGFEDAYEDEEKETDPRRAAGNVLVGQGAVTAETMKGLDVASMHRLAAMHRARVGLGTPEAAVDPLLRRGVPEGLRNVVWAALVRESRD